MIKLNQVSGGYQKEIKIHQITQTIQAGQILGIIGPNGCGKTTLLKMIARLLPLAEGTIEYSNKDIQQYEPKEFAKKISILPQVRDVPSMTVESLVGHGRFPYLPFSRIKSEEDKRQVQDALKQTATEEFASVSLKELSGGERQKAYIAMTIAQDSEVMLFDEPTTYLDVYRQIEIMELITGLKQQGKTVIVVLHDLSQALFYCDHLWIMDQGQIVAEGNAEDLNIQKKIEEVFRVHLKVLGTDGIKRYFIY